MTKTHTIGVIMNGVTGRMGTNQHLLRSVAAIREQGGLKIGEGEIIMPDPILVGRNETKLAELAARAGVTRYTTDLDGALADDHNTIYFDAQLTNLRGPAVKKAIQAGKNIYCEKPSGTTTEESYELYTLAKAAGVQRFVQMSSCSVYGVSGDRPSTELDPVEPLTAYAKCKVLVEHSVGDLADDTFSPVFLRNATAFGFSPRPRADIVLNNLVGHAHLTGQVRVLSDGTPWRPLVHAADIADAFAAALTAPREAVHARAFNVGCEQNNLTVAEIAAHVVEAVPGSEVVITGETGADPRSYRVDFSRIRAALPGCHARWTVKAGAVELAEAYRDYGLGAHDFERRFTRLARLAGLRAAGTVSAELRL